MLLSLLSGGCDSLILENPAQQDQEKIREVPMKGWLRNVWNAVWSVGEALWVTVRTWMASYDPKRRTFTHRYEYPERPAVLAEGFRGIHRYDLRLCIACERCARDCPIRCIYMSKRRVEGRKGFQVTAYVIDYTKCMFCGICTENCPKDCIKMGRSYDLSGYERNGCMVDFAKLPLEIAWAEEGLDGAAVARSALVTEPVHPGPEGRG